MIEGLSATKPLTVASHLVILMLEAAYGQNPKLSKRAQMILSKKELIKFIFIAASLLFMALYVWRTVRQVGNFPPSPDIDALMASLLINWLGFVTVILVWKFLITSYGERITTGQAYRIYFRSNLGKYLPGKVWQLAGMVFLCDEIGIMPNKSIPASLYNTGVAVITGLAIFFVTVSIDTLGLTRALVSYTLLVAIIVFLIVFPDFLTGLMNRILRILGKERIEEGIGRGILFTTFVSYALAWFIFGWGFHLFLRFLGVSKDLDLLETVGIFSGSVSIGFLAFFSPGGIGIREGVMVFLMEKYYPLTTAIFISVTARLWITAVELSGFLSTYVFPIGSSTESQSK
ncbi:MAG: lysylphosphatidylglycerol synthase domain-containing protein [Candidatus Glassbacteria bacterium]